MNTYTYKWLGTGAVHTPSGPAGHGDLFEAGSDWVSAHPQRRWLKMGLMVLVVPDAEPEKKEVKAKSKKGE